MAVRKDIPQLGPPHRRGGFSLVEASVSVVIVSVMLVAALTTLGASARGRMLLAGRWDGPALARTLMGEILQASYVEPSDDPPVWGPEPGESAGTSREAFDDLDDYDGWSSSPPCSRDGSALSQYAGWTRSADVKYADPLAPGITSPTDVGLIRVTVTVTDSGGQMTSLIALRSSLGTYDQEPAVQAEYVTAVALALQVGAETSGRITSGTHLLNRVPYGP